jgi:hypothetical protein
MKATLAAMSEMPGRESFFLVVGVIVNVSKQRRSTWVTLLCLPRLFMKYYDFLERVVG